MTTINDQAFEIEINPKLEEKLRWFVDNYDKEIGAWLTGKIGENKIYIDDFLVYEQEVGGASVDNDGKSLVKLRKEYGDKCKTIIGHWHSHNTMSAHWSGTDDTFINQYAGPRDVTIFMVSSRDDGHLVRLEIRKPLKISMDELKYKIGYTDSKIEKTMQEIIDKKLVEEKPVIKPEVEIPDEYTDPSYWSSNVILKSTLEYAYIDDKDVVVKNIPFELAGKYDKFLKKFKIDEKYENETLTLTIHTKKVKTAFRLLSFVNKIIGIQADNLTKNEVEKYS